MSDAALIELTPHECDLVVRILGFALAQCAERLRHDIDLEKVAITWLRDDIDALMPKFREHTTP